MGKPQMEQERLMLMADPRYRQCEMCGKVVRVKPILGTLHICLSDDEVIEVMRRRRSGRSGSTPPRP